jgi:hypothetical protein
VIGTVNQGTSPWVTGTDGVTTGIAATVRTHNSFNELYVRDRTVVAVLSEMLFELQQLNSQEIL